MSRGRGRLARSRLLFVLLAAGCGGSHPGLSVDGAGQSRDAPEEPGADAAGEPGADAEADAGAGPEAGGCVPCAADHFCSAASGTCVSAVVSVAAGTSHTCAVHKDGTVSCWGHGPFILPDLPVVVTPPASIPLPGPAVTVAVGIQAACALLADGTVECWGDLAPGGPQAPAKIVQQDGSPLGQVTQIAGGSQAFCGVAAAGVYCWGDNGSSELARPATMTFPPTTALLAHPGSHPVVAATVAIVDDDGQGTLCGWGDNDSGIIPGDQSIVEQPACMPMFPTVLQLSAGDGHVCARRGGATFSCWGTNSGGQLGNGDQNAAPQALPGMLETLPAEIASLAAGAYHTCALLKTGAVSCWGNNDSGECGLPSSAPVFSPMAVPALASGVVGIGAGAGAQHTCVIMQDGSVQCWGNDDEGQLGSGATTEDSGRSSATPLPVRW